MSFISTRTSILTTLADKPERKKMAQYTFGHCQVFHAPKRHIQEVLGPQNPFANNKKTPLHEHSGSGEDAHLKQVFPLVGTQIGAQSI